MRKGAVEFFYTHAGFSYDPKTETPEQGRQRCAEAWAKAERAAWEDGCTFEWVDDPDDCGDGDTTPETREGCIMRNEAGEELASLWSIGDADEAYRRVIEAELALEAGY